MNCHKCESIPEVLATLQELKSELRGVKNEILGISKEAQANPTGLMEHITLKQIVEKTAYDVERLRKGIDEQNEARKVEARNNSEQTLKVEQEQTSTSGTEDMGTFVPKDIIVNTVAEETDLLKSEVEAIKYDKTLVKGQSFHGKTYGPTHPSFGGALAIVINNYLGETVSIKTWTHIDYGNYAESPPNEIASGKSEIIRWISRHMTAGLVRLSLGTSDIRIVLFGYGCDKKAVSGRSFITTHSNIQLDMDLCNCLWLTPNDTWKYTTNIAYHEREDNRADMFARLGDIRIRSATAIEQQLPVVTIEVGSVQGLGTRTELALIPASLETSVKPRLKSHDTLPSVLASITHSHACVIQIGNALPVNLGEPLIPLYAGVSTSIPNEAKTQTLDYAVAYHGRKFEGLVSYRVGATDLRLILGFRLRENENEFALGLFSYEGRVDTSLLKLLFEDDPYFVREDMRHGKATDGTLRLIRRNIVAEAKMTSNKKAVLEVLIATF